MVKNYTLITLNIILFIVIIVSCKKMDEDKNNTDTYSDSTSVIEDSTNNADIISVNSELISISATYSDRNFYSVSHINSDIYVSGDGVILKSSDEGNIFDAVFELEDFLFFDVEFASSEIGYACGFSKNESYLNAKSKLYKTVDGGENWFLIHEATHKKTTQEINKFDIGEMRNGAISILDENRLMWGVGSRMYYSNTGGRSNYDIGVAGGSIFNAVYLSVEDFISGGGYGEYQNWVGGLSNSIGNLPTSYDYYDFVRVADKIGYGVQCKVGESNLVVYDVNSRPADSYKKCDLNFDSNASKYFGLDFYNLEKGIVVGENGSIIITYNGGNNWTKVNFVTTEQLNHIDIIDKEIAIAIGNNGTIVKLTFDEMSGNMSDDISFTETESIWQNKTISENNDLHKIEIIDDKIFICGDNIILKSQDNGNSFQTLLSDEQYLFRDLTFTSSAIGYVIGIKSLDEKISILKTIDSGNTWEVVHEFDANIYNTGDEISRTGVFIESNQAGTIFAGSSNLFGGRDKQYSLDGENWNSLPGTSGNTVSISDFIFYNNVVNQNNIIGYGSILESGGSYAFYPLETGDCGYVKGCETAPAPEHAIKRFGMNAIATDGKHMAIASDKKYSQSRISGTVELTEQENPTLASHWYCYPTYCPENMYGVKIINDKIWLCGDNGIIITSAEDGRFSEFSEEEPHLQWYGHNTGTHEDLNDINFLNDNIAIAVGKNGTLLVCNNAKSNYLIH